MESQRVSTNYPRTRPRRFVSVLKDITPTTQNLVEINARSRRLSGSLIAAPPLSKAIEKKKENIEEQQKKRALLSRRRSIDPSILSRPNSETVKKSSTPVSAVETNTRIRRFSGSGLIAPQQIKTYDDKSKNEDITPKKTVTLSRRRTIDPSTLSRNDQPNLDDAQQKLRTLAIIAEKRKEKKEEEERKKKEDEDRAEAYEKKFKSFKTKALMIRSANGKLTERIVNLQNEMMEINCRLSQLTTERVIHMIETVLNA